MIIRKKVLPILLAVVMTIVLIPATGARRVEASSANGISYMYFYYDTNYATLNTSYTEGEVQERFRKTAGTSTYHISIDPVNCFLNYYNEEFDLWYGVGDGSNQIDKNKQYSLTYAVKVEDGYDLTPSAYSLPTTEVAPITDCPEMHIYLNGVERFDVLLRRNPNNNMLYIDIPIVPGITIMDAEITGVTDKTYTGKALQQDPVVKIGSQQLVEGMDYTLTYANNKNPGTAFVLINGIGSYRGVTGKRFTIYYKDVPASHSYKNAVYWATELGLAAGYTGDRAGYFGVSDNITRGQVVTFLWRDAGKPEPAGKTQTFSDVPTKSNFYKAIQWAYEQGITGGYTGARAGQFGPSDNCTRGQIVMFLWRYAGKPAPAGKTQTFYDVPTSSNFYKAIQWASEQEITAGYSDGTFGVNKNCTRGHCVTFMFRMSGPKG